MSERDCDDCRSGSNCFGAIAGSACRDHRPSQEHLKQRIADLESALNCQKYLAEELAKRVQQLEVELLQKSAECNVLRTMLYDAGGGLWVSAEDMVGDGKKKENG